MSDLYKYLSPVVLNQEDLLLDPNNPRFAELGEEIRPIPEARFAESKVQEVAAQKMRSQIFDVQELRDTIATIGFLQMDRLVVRKWKNSSDSEQPKYVVIEGNRRLAAIRWLLELHDEGKKTLSEDQVNAMGKFECLLLDDEVAPESAQIILPGLRHVSGIKEWGPYQKAKAVHVLRQTGMSSQEVAQSLGLSTRAANASYRCYLALEAMKTNEEFGDYADPKMFSYFEEVFKRPNVRSWLGWDDNAGIFQNTINLEEFYSWITPSEDQEEPKIPRAIAVRDLGAFIEDETALAVFRSKEGSLARALARYQLDHPADWFPTITAATTAVSSLTPDMLRQLDQDSLSALIELRDRINLALQDREKLTAK
ncbi:MAG: hypothetical protein EPO31_07885 [Gammaproteobacteria bacterium]|nr:MAG: hypothetical protein EPO31_07885 [Gammaproteobacteria bacterium]